jgi:hypothetical protein
VGGGVVMHEVMHVVVLGRGGAGKSAFRPIALDRHGGGVLPCAPSVRNEPSRKPSMFC